MLAHQHLLDLVEVALLASPAVAGGNVHRQRTRPMAAGADQMVSLRLVSSRGAPLFLGGDAPIEWQSVIAVECIARGASSASPDEAVAGLLEVVHARIVSDAATKAAQYRIDPEHRIEWDQDELDERIGAATSIYTVRHLGALESIAA